MTETSSDLPSGRPETPSEAVPMANRLRRSRGRWRILAFVVAAVAVLAVAGRFAFDGGGAVPHIARVVIDGTIATDPERLRTLQALGDDALVKGVIVAINSPGGTTAGGEELYEALSALREKKPVAAVVSELGASAAYMTAIAADRIFARRLSLVGSIGVLYQHVDAGKLLETIGVGMDKVASGPLKAEPDFSGPIRPDVRQSLEGLIADSFDWFVTIVAERRGLSHDEALKLADGRIFTGRQGLADRLIDAIGGEPEAIAWLEAEHDVAPGLPVATVYPRADDRFGWLTRLVGSEARAALGFNPTGPVVLDGLVSLWQVTPAS